VPKIALPAHDNAPYNRPSMKNAASLPKQSKFVGLASVCIVVTALYFARSVLIPLALGTLLAFLLAPLGGRLERLGLRRAFASVIVVVLALAVVGGIGWTISSQVTNLASELPQYQSQIAERIRAVEAHLRRGPFARASKAVAELTSEATSQPAAPGQPSGTEQKPIVVTFAQPPSVGLLGALSDLIVVLEPTAQVILVIAVATFMLVWRDDLRDRLLRLMGEGRLTVSTQAMNEAALRVSQYLLTETVINGCYAIVTAIALYFIGVPNAALWGLLCGVLRFIPYVGVWIAAAFPILISLILPASGEWFVRPLVTLGFFLTLELIVGNVIEPLMYGSKTGVSPVAIIVAAVFWTWLWGPAGLVLSTPLTVLLAVAGKHMPRLQFLHVLLGDEPVLLPSTRIYQRFLADDHENARELVDEMIKTQSPEALYDGSLIPVLLMAQRDAMEGSLEQKRLRGIQLAIAEIVEDCRVADIGEGGVPKAAMTGPPRLPREASVSVVVLPAQDKSDEITGLMLSHLLERRGYHTEPVGHEMLASEMVETTGQREADIVCISALPPGALSHARYLCKRLSKVRPDARMLVGLWGAPGDAEQAKRRLACAESVTVAMSLVAALEQAQQMAQGVLVKKE